MQSLPHRYRVEASASCEGPVGVTSQGIPSLSTAAPVEFGGPGDLWSPETLLVAAVVDCFVLTFRALARASSLEWLELRCEGEGELDRIDRVTRFSAMSIRANLTLPNGANREKADRLLEKAEASCLISNSLVCPVKLESRLTIQ